jgi:hypothetical protein
LDRRDFTRFTLKEGSGNQWGNNIYLPLTRTEIEHCL